MDSFSNRLITIKLKPINEMLSPISPRKKRLPRSDSILGRKTLKNIAKNVALEYVNQCYDELQVDNVDIYTKSKEKNDRKIVKDLDSMHGVEGLHSFQHHYKQVTRLRKIINPKEFKASPPISYIKSVDKLKLSPLPSGIVRKEESLSKVDIKEFSIGNKYAKSIGKAIKSFRSLKEISASNNRLTNIGAIKLLFDLPINVTTLDLSNNKLTFDAFQKIASLIRDPRRILNEINLENNFGKNEGASYIFNAISENITVTYLNLSNNEITDEGALAIASMLLKNGNLKILMVHWNKIGPMGAIEIAKSLMANKYLLVFDCSYNSFGGSPNQESAKAFKRMFKKNTYLIHLDLSYNGFKETECNILSKGLKKNHTILGIHMLGNDATVDAKGFLNIEKNNNISFSHVYSRISNKLQFGTKSIKELIQMKVYNNCWICEGWSQIKFTFHSRTFHAKEYKEGDSVFVHLSFENYEPDEMTPDKKNIYTLIRMVPPGELKYYFSINQQYFYVDPKSQSVPFSSDNTDLKNVSVVQVSKVNIMKNIIQRKDHFSESIVDMLTCIPRPLPKGKKEEERVRTPWDFKNSIFKDYKNDNEFILSKCFEYDWSNTKMIDNRFIKSDEVRSEIKEALRKNYKTIREIYKYYSAVEPCDRVFSISSNVILDILNKCELIDLANLKISDVSIEFIATNTASPGEKKSDLNPDRFITRPEFLELLVRMSLRKYKKVEGVSPVQAVELFIEQIVKYFEPFDCHKWRSTYLWNEECDLVLKKYFPAIKLLFAKYSGRYTLPGNPKFISLDEFIELIVASNFVDEKFGNREISILFNLSMMTCVEELEKERHLNMMKDEFIEALSRIAFRVNAKSPYDKEELDQEILEGLPFPIKIKNFIETLMVKCLSREDREYAQKQILAQEKEKEKEKEKPK